MVKSPHRSKDYDETSESSISSDESSILSDDSSSSSNESIENFKIRTSTKKTKILKDELAAPVQKKRKVKRIKRRAKKPSKELAKEGDSLGELDSKTKPPADAIKTTARKRKNRQFSIELTKKRNVLHEILGGKVKVPDPATKITEKGIVTSSDKVPTDSTDVLVNKKMKITKFRFPKSASKGQYSNIKSRYLDVFKKKKEVAP